MVQKSRVDCERLVVYQFNKIIHAVNQQNLKIWTDTGATVSICSLGLQNNFDY